MIDTQRVAIFNKWFKCPRCAGRNIIWSKRGARYTCRKCGTLFRADRPQQRTVEVREGVKSE